MCGRYAASRDPEDLMVEFEAADATEGIRLPADFNVAPTKQVPAVVTRRPRGEPDADPVRQLRIFQWGLVPSWAKDPKIGSRLINARAESVTEKPAFRKALAARRCLLPADGWYEWRKRSDGPGKQPYFMHPRDGSGLALAGLYEFWTPKDDPEADVLITCTVVTTAAVGPLAEIHDRMPLVLARGDWARWLDPARDQVPDLLEPPSESLVESLELRPVGRQVGSVDNNGPGLTVAIDELSAGDEPSAVHEPSTVEATLF